MTDYKLISLLFPVTTEYSFMTWTVRPCMAHCQKDITVHSILEVFILEQKSIRRYNRFCSVSIYTYISIIIIRCKMTSVLKKMSLSEDIFIMKGYFVAKLFSVHYLSRPFFWSFCRQLAVIHHTTG